MSFSPWFNPFLNRPASILILLTGSSLLLFLSPKWIQYFKPIAPPPSSTKDSDSKALPSLPSVRKPIAIFWDVDNCAPPTSSSGRDIALAIRKAVQLATHNSVADVNGNENPILTFKAYLELSAENSAPLSREQVNLRSELQGCGISLIDTPKSGRKDVADFMIISDLLAHAIDHPPPYRIVLISGDRDFAYPLGVLRNRGYEILLVTPPVGAPPILQASAHLVLSWRRDVLGIQKDSIGRSYEDKPTNNGIKNSNLNSRESNSSPIKKSVIQTPQKPTQHTYPQYQSYPSTFVSYKKQQQTQLDRPQPPTSQTMSPDLFQPLTNLLRGLAREGEAFPLRSMVCERLSKKVYKDIGASRWADYAQAAELSGAVVLGIHEGRVGTEWVALPEEMKKKEEQDRKQLEIQNGKVQREKEHRIFVQKEKERLEQSKKQEDVRLVPRAVTVTAANAVKESITQQTGASSKAPVSKENGSTSLLSGGNSEDAKKEVASSQKTKNGDVLPSTAASTTLTVKPFLRDEPWNGKLTMPVDRFYPLFEIMKQLASDYSESSTGSSNSTNSSSVSEDPIARASKVQKSLAYLKQQNVFDSYSASGVNDFQEFMKVAEEQGVARLRLKIKEKKLSKFLESDGKDKGKGKAKEEGENENESAIKGREIVVLREKFKRAYTGVPTKGAERMEDTTTATLPEEKPKRSSSPIKKAFKKTLFGDSKADATEEKLVDPIVTHKPSNLPIRKSLLPLVNLLNNQLLLSRNFVVPSFLHKSLLKLPSSEIKIMRVKNKDEFLDFLTRAENDGVIEISKGFNEGEEQVRLSKQFHGVQTRNVGQDYQAQREFRGNEEFLAEEKENGKGKPKEEEEWVDEEEGQTQKDGLSDGAFGGLASGAFNWFANNQDLASMNPIGADSTKMKKARSHSPSKKSTSKISQQESEEDLGELVGRGGTSKAGNGKAEDEEDEEVLEWGNYAKRV